MASNSPKPRSQPSRDALLNLIDTIKIVKRVQKHVMGTLKEPMTDSQLRAAGMLISRTFPEVRHSSAEVTTFNGDPNEISNAELAAIISAHSGADAPGKKESTH